MRIDSFVSQIFFSWTKIFIYKIFTLTCFLFFSIEAFYLHVCFSCMYEKESQNFISYVFSSCFFMVHDVFWGSQYNETKLRWGAVCSAIFLDLWVIPARTLMCTTMVTQKNGRKNYFHLICEWQNRHQSEYHRILNLINISHFIWSVKPVPGLSYIFLHCCF